MKGYKYTSSTCNEIAKEGKTLSYSQGVDIEKEELWIITTSEYKSSK